VISFRDGGYESLPPIKDGLPAVGSSKPGASRLGWHIFWAGLLLGAGEIDVFLPTTTGTGEAYVYVTAGAVLTNLQAVTINP